MKYLTQKELKEMMLLSRERIEEKKEEINKINIFPVPDQDTGNNMAKTLSGIKEAMGDGEFKDLNEISEVILDGALTAAQGNAGVIYTGFLAGFLTELDKNPVDCKKLALAFEKGAERARASIQNPVEGTILDVIDAASLTLKKQSDKETNIINALREATKDANEALLATREKMEIFKKANVVDAGGLAFLIILESYSEALGGKEEKEEKEEKPSEKIRRFIQVLSNRYEVVSLVENPSLEIEAVQKKLRKLGNSIDVVKVGNRMKIHIHTDYVDGVKDVIRSLGQIQDLRIEDMAKEVVGEKSVRIVSIGIVTENTAMLLPKVIERYHVESIDVKHSLSPKTYLDAFKKQLQRFDKVLCITSSSKIGDHYNSAKQAKIMVSSPKKVFVFDSLNTAAGLSLLVLRAIELIQEQREIDEVIKKLKNLTHQVRLYIAPKDPKWAERFEGITKSQANWMKKMKKLRVHPILKIKDGAITKGWVIFAQNIQEALVKKILKSSRKARKEGKKIRVVIGHADNLEAAQELKKSLKNKISAEIPFINLAPPSICATMGPGTLIVGWMPIE